STPASTRTSTSRRKPKRSSSGTQASSPGPKPPATDVSSSTALRGSYEAFPPGTRPAPSPTSNRSSRPRLQHTDRRQRSDARNNGRAEGVRGGSGAELVGRLSDLQSRSTRGARRNGVGSAATHPPVSQR